MKRYLLFITCLTLLCNTASHAAGPTGSLGEGDGANDNPHNLSSLSSNAKLADTETQICIFCHTPHGATPQSTLWSRPDPTGPNPPGDGTFPTFSEPASVQDLSGVLGINDPGIVASDTHYGINDSNYEYPNGSSKLCLSCHDGVTAMGILANGDIIDMNTTGGDIAGAVDLSTSHPISFVYNAAVQIYLNNLPTKIDNYNLPTLTSGYLDGASRVQCTSCHQPHQDTKTVTYNLPFWKGAGSNDEVEYDAVCAACHTTLYNVTTFPDHIYPQL